MELASADFRCARDSVYAIVGRQPNLTRPLIWAARRERDGSDSFDAEMWRSELALSLEADLGKEKARLLIGDQDQSGTIYRITTELAALKQTRDEKLLGVFRRYRRLEPEQVSKLVAQGKSRQKEAELMCAYLVLLLANAKPEAVSVAA
jgi:hypothetical protein